MKRKIHLALADKKTIRIQNTYIGERYLRRQAVKFSVEMWSFLRNAGHAKAIDIECKQPERDTIAERGVEWYALH